LISFVNRFFYEFITQTESLSNATFDFVNEVNQTFDSGQSIYVENSLSDNGTSNNSITIKKNKKKKKKKKKQETSKYMPLYITDVTLCDEDRSDAIVIVPRKLLWNIEAYWDSFKFFSRSFYLLKHWVSHVNYKIMLKYKAPKCLKWRKNRAKRVLMVPELVPLTEKKYDRKTVIKRRVICVYANRERLKREMFYIFYNRLAIAPHFISFINYFIRYNQKFLALCFFVISRIH
jgi:hypothetical protein